MRHFAELRLAPSVALTENERLMKRLHNRMQDAQDAALIIHQMAEKGVRELAGALNGATF
jgi:hypothetical protein